MLRIRPIDDPDSLRAAAERLRAGGLVAFPTETVYGLGADATDDIAVARIFEAKGRPRINPLIVHVPDSAAAARVADLPVAVEPLTARFWPGALTLVLPRREAAGLSRLASAGLPTIAVRVPALPEARALLKAVDRPVAAPSANASGRLSPVTAAHVAESLGERVDLILDGGPCRVGVESTIVDLSGERPVLLRQGGLAQEEIEAVLGSPVASANAAGEDAETSGPKAPGMLSSHYAPGLPIRLDAQAPRPGEAYLAFGDQPPAGAFANLSPAGDLREAAAALFRLLHAADDPARFDAIAVAPVPETGLGRAINDRLRRAAAPRDDRPAGA